MRGEEPGADRSMAASKSHTSTRALAPRAAKSAASLHTLAISAPEKPGVSDASLRVQARVCLHCVCVLSLRRLPYLCARSLATSAPETPAPPDRLLSGRPGMCLTCGFGNSVRDASPLPSLYCLHVLCVPSYLVCLPVCPDLCACCLRVFCVAVLPCVRAAQCSMVCDVQPWCASVPSACAGRVSGRARRVCVCVCQVVKSGVCVSSQIGVCQAW